jgi:hypothetical protein
LTATKVITAPSSSKTYIVDNAATGGTVTFKASGQTGVSVAVAEKCTVYYNGTDYVKVASSVTDGVSTISFGSTGLTPATATAGAVTVAGTLAVANGGTGTTTPSIVAGTAITVTGTWPNQTIASTGTGTAGSLVTTNFSIVESGGKLLFKYGATTIASMTSAGVFTTISDITGNGTP